MPAISVIVPVYNVEPYLHRCVDSILSQSFADFDLILINDGSLDNCGAICDEYAQADPRIHVIHQKNAGLSAARNAGIDRAFANSDSQWLTFIDSDDWVHSCYLELLLSTAISFNVKISNIGTIGVHLQDPLPPRRFVSPQLVSPTSIFNASGGVASVRKLYARELFKNIRFPIGKLHEDEFVTHRLLFSQDKIANIDEPMYYYFIRPGSIMHSTWSPRHLDALEAKEEQLKYFEAHGHLDQYTTTYNQYLLLLSKHFTAIQAQDSLPDKKKYLKLLKFKSRNSIRHHGSAPNPTLKTAPYVFNIAYPTLMRIFWTMKALWSKFCR